MQIDITFRGLTQDQANNLFASIRHDYNGPAPIVEPAPELVAAVPAATSGFSQVVGEAKDAPAVLTTSAPITRKPGRPRKEKDHGTPSRSEPAEAGHPPVAPAGESAAGTSTPTLDDVRAALSKVMETKGAEACAAILNKFSVPRISALFAEQYEAFIKECGK